MSEDFKYYYWYYRYHNKFTTWIWYDWHKDGNMIKKDVANILKRMERNKFISYMKTCYDDKFPFFYNIYWAFKFACGVSRSEYEYVYFNDYIKSVTKGIRTIPNWMTDQFPTETQIPGLIPCSNAINERKEDLKYEIHLKNFIDFDRRGEFRLYEQCDIHDWLIETCNGEWYFDEFAGDLKILFTNEEDAMVFKLRWT